MRCRVCWHDLPLRSHAIKYLPILILTLSAALGALLAIIGSVGLAFLVWIALGLASQVHEFIRGWKWLAADYAERKALRLSAVIPIPVPA